MNHVGICEAYYAKHILQRRILQIMVPFEKHRSGVSREGGGGGEGEIGDGLESHIFQETNGFLFCTGVGRAVDRQVEMRLSGLNFPCPKARNIFPMTPILRDEG